MCRTEADPKSCDSLEMLSSPFASSDAVSIYKLCDRCLGGFEWSLNDVEFSPRDAIAAHACKGRVESRNAPKTLFLNELLVSNTIPEILFKVAKTPVEASTTFLLASTVKSRLFLFRT